MSAERKQLELFAMLVVAQVVGSRRDLAAAQSRHRRDVAVAIGQIGDQLALSLWRGDELARSMRRQPLCLACRDALEPALRCYEKAPRGRASPPTRILPMLGATAD
jgi:hypothetical protein